MFFTSVWSRITIENPASSPFSSRNAFVMPAAQNRRPSFFFIQRSLLALPSRCCSVKFSLRIALSYIVLGENKWPDLLSNELRFFKAQHLLNSLVPCRDPSMSVQSEDRVFFNLLNERAISLLALAQLDFGNLAVGDIPGETACMNEPAILPKDIGANQNVADRSIFATHPGFVIVELLAFAQAPQDIADHIFVRMELGYGVTDIFVSFITKQVEFGAICAQNNSVRPNPMRPSVALSKKSASSRSRRRS